jgi:hypothetical protein
MSAFDTFWSNPDNLAYFLSIVPAPDDAPLPFEDWGYTPEPDDTHPHGLSNHGNLCPDCEGEGGDVMDEDNYWVCDLCHGCGYFPPCDAHAPLPVPPNPNELETWQDVIPTPTPESE